MKNSILEKARWLREVALATSKNNGARVAREWLKYAAMFVMLFTIGSGNVWGEDETLTITGASPGHNAPWTTSYGTSTGTASTSASTKISLSWTQVARMSTTIQIKAGTSNGFYSTSCPETNNKIKSIKITNKTNSGYLYCSTDGKTWSDKIPYTSGTEKDVSTSNYKYFKVTATDKYCQLKSIVVTYTAGGEGSCDNCEYYVYNGSSFVKIGETGSTDVVLTPPNLDNHSLAGSYGGWSIYEDIQNELGCVYDPNNNNHEYRFVPNPAGLDPDDDNKPSGACKLYAVYYNGSTSCLDTKVSAPNCVRYVEPQDLTSTVSGSNATLSWTDESPTPATKYYLTLVGDDYSWDGEVTATSKDFTSLPAGDYMWEVYAISTTDNQCNSTTKAASFTIVGCTDISSSTVTGVSVTPSKEGGSATWTAVADATRYEVKVYAGTATSGVALFSAEPTSNSCTITGLSANTQYTVAIKAKNGCSISSTAGTKTFMTQNVTLYHIDFVNQNNTSSHPAQLEQTSEGQNLDIPANSGGNVTAPSAACSSADWTFAGWKVGSAQEETTSAPSLVAAGTTGYAMDGNKTFYAVFTKTEGGGGGVKTTLLSSTCADAKNFTDEDWPTKDTYNLTDPAGALRLGTSKATGSITSKSLSAAVGTTIKVDFEARAYNLKDNGNINVTVSGCDQQSVLWKTYGGSTSEYTSCSLSFVTTTPSFTVTIATSAKRAVLKNIEIYHGGGGGGTTYWNSNPSCSSDATVTYHNDGAKSGAAPTDANSPYTIGTQVTVLGTGTMVAPDGKEFKCWNTAADGTGTDYNIGATFDIAGNMDFYPKWVNAPYTVRFDAEDGTCGTTSLTEASGGAGVTLPAATATCAPHGWSFYGWATAAVSETTTAPATFVGAAGATYYPTENVTLHAVYKEGGNAIGTGSFTKVTGKDNLVNNAFYIVTNVNNSGGMMNNTVTSSPRIGTSTNSYDACDDIDCVWQLKQSGEYWQIYNPNKNLYAAGTGTASRATLMNDGTDDKTKWTVTVTDAGYRFQNKYNTDQGVNAYLSYSAGNGYACMAHNNGGDVLFLYKANSGAIVTGTITYNSNPSCTTYNVTIGSHTNGTITVNGTTDSPQESLADQKITLTATPESGYRFTGWTITKTTGGNDVTSTLLPDDKATTASTDFTMPAYDVTVSAMFTAIVYHTVTWKNNGVTLTGAKLGSADVSVEHGLKVANLPPDLSSTSDDNCDGESNVFVGWTSNSWSGKQADAPAILFKKAEDAPAVNADVTYHAVWAKPE